MFMSKIQISKLDAAKEEIETAIYLYFHRETDVVSIHTLASAALKIVRNISDATGKESVLTQGVDVLIKPEGKSLFWTKFHESANYFKHAERDFDKSHLFNPEINEYVIFFAVQYFRALTNSLSRKMREFEIWFMIKHPNLIIADKIREVALQVPSDVNKTEFLEVLKYCK
jgi:hypothetical protein